MNELSLMRLLNLEEGGRVRISQIEAVTAIRRSRRHAGAARTQWPRLRSSIRVVRIGNLGGAIGIAVSASVVNDRTNLHFLRIAEHLNFSNTELVGWLHRMTSHYIRPGAIR
jgi:hypothetical protein